MDQVREKFWCLAERGERQEEEWKEMQGYKKKRKKKHLNSFISILLYYASFIQIEFFNQVLLAEWTEGLQMKMGLNRTHTILLCELP